MSPFISVIYFGTFVTNVSWSGSFCKTCKIPVINDYNVFDGSNGENGWNVCCQTPPQLANPTQLQLIWVGVDFVFLEEQEEGTTHT